MGQAISGLRNDYFEDPTWGLAGMRRLREKLSTPLATNTIVIDFEQLGTNVRDPAVDVHALIAEFAQRRHIRQRRCAMRSVHGECAKCALRDLRVIDAGRLPRT